MNQNAWADARDGTGPATADEPQWDPCETPGTRPGTGPPLPEAPKGAIPPAGTGGLWILGEGPRGQFRTLAFPLTGTAPTTCPAHSLTFRYISLHFVSVTFQHISSHFVTCLHSSSHFITFRHMSLRVATCLGVLSHGVTQCNEM